MADTSDHIQNGSNNIRRSLSGNSVPTKSVMHIASPGVTLNEDYNFGSPRKRTHKKSPSVFKDINDAFVSNGGAPKQLTASKPQRDPADVSTNGSACDVGQSGIPPPSMSARPQVSLPSTVSNLTAFSGMTHESGSSSGSGSTSTVRTSSNSRRDDAAKTRIRQRRTSVRRPNALNFLDSDSPDISPEVIQQSLESAPHKPSEDPESTSPSNRSASSAASSFQDDASDTVEGHETDRSTSPERSINGEDKGPMRTPVAARIDISRARRRSYGAPEVSYATASQPYMSPNAATPRAPNQGPFIFPPRVERMPLTGYELITARLCRNLPDHSGPPLKPMYRRFEALNHRLLLHLQDEICELEEQLHRLDTTDTQNRRMPNCILPASRRADQHSGIELHWHRLDVLGKIGFKLEQYNNVLASFRKTQFFPTPSLADIHDYRSFLASHTPIVEQETRFLDAMDDLVCVNESVEEDEEEEEEEESDDDDHSSDESDTLATPMPKAEFNLRSRSSSLKYPGLGVSVPPLHRSPSPRDETSPPDQLVGGTIGNKQQQHGLGMNNYLHHHHQTQTQDRSQPTTLLLSLSLGMAGAILLPVLTFAAIPGFVGRMAVVFVVLVGGVGALLQGDLLGDLGGSTRDICVCAACYGAVMAVLAGAMG